MAGVAAPLRRLEQVQIRAQEVAQAQDPGFVEGSLQGAQRAADRQVGDLGVMRQGRACHAVEHLEGVLEALQRVLAGG
jgi:hypothetical protein